MRQSFRILAPLLLISMPLLAVRPIQVTARGALYRDGPTGGHMCPHYLLATFRLPMNDIKDGDFIAVTAAIEFRVNNGPLQSAHFSHGWNHNKANGDTENYEYCVWEVAQDKVEFTGRVQVIKAEIRN